MTSAAFSPDGSRVVTASRDNTARLWDVATAQQIGERIQVPGDALRSAAFSPDGRQIITASDDNTARLWDAEGESQSASRSKAPLLRSARTARAS